MTNDQLWYTEVMPEQVSSIPVVFFDGLVLFSTWIVFDENVKSLRLTGLQESKQTLKLFATTEAYPPNLYNFIGLSTGTPPIELLNKINRYMQKC